jgi:N-methylhydantoinase B
MNPGNGAEPLDSKLTMTFRQGDVFRHELAGGGGWGDPLERNPEHVLADVRNEYVSVDGARRDYGVVIDDSAWSVDVAATEKLRKSRSLARGDATLPAVAWADE